MNVYGEISAERARQEAEWGQEHDDAQRAPHWEELIATFGSRAFHERVRTGNHDMTGWRRRMVQIAALAVAAIESHDRRSRAPADRADRASEEGTGDG